MKSIFSITEITKKCSLFVLQILENSFPQNVRSFPQKVKCFSSYKNQFPRKVKSKNIRFLTKVRLFRQKVKSFCQKVKSFPQKVKSFPQKVKCFSSYQNQFPWKVKSMNIHFLTRSNERKTISLEGQIIFFS